MPMYNDYWLLDREYRGVYMLKPKKGGKKPSLYQDLIILSDFMDRDPPTPEELRAIEEEDDEDEDSDDD